ncbi:MAG: hypothetical protein ACOY94_22995 [Bacillota bacterium]
MIEDTRSQRLFRLGNMEGQILDLVRVGDVPSAEYLAETTFGKGSWAEFVREFTKLGLLTERESHPDEGSATKQTRWRLSLPGITKLCNLLVVNHSVATYAQLATVLLVGVVFYTLSGNLSLVLFNSPIDNTGILWASSLLIPAFVAHELGHMFWLRVAGGEVGETGLMLWYGTPAFYVDTSDVWRLPSKFDRVRVMLGGVQAQMLFTAVCALALSQFSQASQTTAAYFLVLSTFTAIGNLWPLGKTDGYWALATLFNRPNLLEECQAAMAQVLGGHRLSPGLLLMSGYALLSAAFPVAVLYAILFAVYPTVALSDGLTWAWWGGVVFVTSWVALNVSRFVLTLKTNRWTKVILAAVVLLGAWRACSAEPTLLTVAEYDSTLNTVVLRKTLPPGAYQVMEPRNGLLQESRSIGALTIQPDGRRSLVLWQSSSTSLLLQYPRMPIWKQALYQLTGGKWHDYV